MAWAREIRGNRSRLKAETCRAASAATRSGSAVGCKKLTTALPARSPSTSSSVGGWTLATTSASAYRAPLDAATSTPLSRYNWSARYAEAPAPVSMASECPAEMRRGATSGTMATRCSPRARSAGMTIRMGCGLVENRQLGNTSADFRDRRSGAVVSCRDDLMTFV